VERSLAEGDESEGEAQERTRDDGGDETSVVTRHGSPCRRG
jgi:hypothetical protein